MPRTEKYFVGPKLLGDIRETITRVAGFSDETSGAHIPYRLQELQRPGGGKVFRICTYTGAWSIGANNTVTFKYQTATPNTASVTNLFLPLPDRGTRDCAIARDGSAWYLLQAQFDTAAFVTDATLTTAALQFNRYNGLALGTASSVSVSVTTCSTAS